MIESLFSQLVLNHFVNILNFIKACLTYFLILSLVQIRFDYNFKYFVNKKETQLRRILSTVVEIFLRV